MRRLLLSMLVMLAAVATASAYDFMVDKLCYQISGTNVKVVQDESYATTLSGALNIPSQVTNNGTTYTVTEIGLDAFNNCTGITSVVIPNTVTTIWNRAFQGSGLTSFNLPASVDYIAASALSFCDNLTTLTVDSNNQRYDSRNNCNAIIYTSMNQLYRACNATVIPSFVNAISSMAFHGCTGITSLTIPDNVMYIYDQAFSNCSNLATVTLPSTLKTIGMGVFEYCTALTSITIPASVVLINEAPFAGCSSLESIVVESGNQYFDSRDNCNAIINTNYHESYSPALAANTLIQGCKTTTIPATVTTIAKNAFKECPITDIEIPEGVTTINTAAFNFCTSLKTVTLPTTLQLIDVFGFNGCSALTDVYAYPAGGSVTLQSNAWFNMIQANCNLHVYPQDFQYYSTADQWKEFNVIGDLEQDYTPELFLIGSFNGWSQETRVPFNLGNDGKLTVTQAMDADAEFKLVKIVEGQSNLIWIGGSGAQITQEQVENGEEINLLIGTGSNFKIPVAGTWTLTVDLDNAKMVISGQWGGQTTDQAMYIIGTFNDWNQNTQEAMTAGENNTWTITKTLEAGAEFKFRDELGTWYGGLDANGVGYFEINKDLVTSSTPITMVDGANFMIPVAGTWTFTVTRGDTMTLVVSGDWNDPQQPLTGDVTGDGEVDIEDVNAVINIILKVKDESDYPGVSDMNNDGTVDVDDMNIIINLILTQTN